jgi:hypothetical protein
MTIGSAEKQQVRSLDGTIPNVNPIHLKPKVQPDSKAVYRAEPSETAVYQPRERVERRSRTYMSSDRFSDHLFRRWFIGCRLR